MIIASMMAMSLVAEAQSFTSLWKKVRVAEEKDLPQQQMTVLRQIAAKAERESAYGHLLRAEMQELQQVTMTAPDSLAPMTARLERKADGATNPVVKAVYHALLYQLYHDYATMPRYRKSNLTVTLDSADAKAARSKQLAMLPVEQLAMTPENSYLPLVVKGANASIFGSTMLPVVGLTVGDYRTLYYHYTENGNRRAACLTALKYLLNNPIKDDYRELKKSHRIMQLDSLINIYSDLDVAGEAAVERYRLMEQCSDVTTEDKISYIHYALDHWGQWQRAGELRNAEKELTASMFQASIKEQLLPGKKYWLHIDKQRNLNAMKMNVYQLRDGKGTSGLKADGRFMLDPNNSDDYKRMKSQLRLLADHSVVKGCKVGAAWQFFKDSLELKPLPVGVYMLEVSTTPATSVWRGMVFVSDVYVMAQALPARQTRYTVVNATTGQPLSGAHLELEYGEEERWMPVRTSNAGKEKTKTVQLVCDENGEAMATHDASRQVRLYAYTGSDRAMKQTTVANPYTSYTYYPVKGVREQTKIMTDRPIYRPGQTVKMAAIMTAVTDGKEAQTVEGRQLKVTLRDANRKVVEEKTLTTDDYGCCHADFLLPEGQLTGRYSLQAGGSYQYFRVEQYKRPTFQLEFPEVNERYAAGDTLEVKAKAMSFAGVPVQGAKVSYRVDRRNAFWWRSAEGTEEGMVWKAEATTDADGRFTVEIPLTLPKAYQSAYEGSNGQKRMPAGFFRFVVTADVTDQAGETRSGEMTVPLGTQPTSFSCSLPEKVLKDSLKGIRFTLRNVAGVELTAPVSFYIDHPDNSRQSMTNELVALDGKLSSGRHQLVAVCEGDTLRTSFVAFGLNDTKPATPSAEWFYASANSFGHQPVTLQMGSSEKDIHLVYHLMAGDQVMERGTLQFSDSIAIRQLTYKEEYGDGVLFCCGWVKDGELHRWSTTISRPLPNKRLKMNWSTFRDRLTPGQQEEWTLQVSHPDGKPAQAHLVATLFDQSLLQLVPGFNWGGQLVWLTRSIPYASLQPLRISSLWGSHLQVWKRMKYKTLDLSRFDIVPGLAVKERSVFIRGAKQKFTSSATRMVADMQMNAAPKMMTDAVTEAAPTEIGAGGEEEEAKAVADDEPAQDVVMRENLQETAFFYPNLRTDEQGNVSMSFTLPESVTTWQWMGLAHTQEADCAVMTAQTVAKKELMVQPQLPRFVRVGDEACLMARVFNTGEARQKLTARMELIHPETMKCVWKQEKTLSVDADSTQTLRFDWKATGETPLLICRMSVKGKDVSDGEQHYLPVIDNRERITVTQPFTLFESGESSFQLSTLFPKSSSQQKLTIEYTNNPAWLTLQALPSVGNARQQDAVSLMAAYYANRMGQWIAARYPQLKTAVAQWKEEGKDGALQSALAKNQELKDLLLAETPWVDEADKESEQKQRLAAFFEPNTIANRLTTYAEALGKLQQSDGSFSWWPGMRGNSYITTEVAMMLARLQTVAPDELKSLGNKATGYLNQQMVEQVDRMKQQEKKGIRHAGISTQQLQWLYLHALAGNSRLTDNHVKAAADYLVTLLKREPKRLAILDKALAAVVFEARGDRQTALDCVESLKQYTVCQKEMGRYYDTPRAAYSWCSYRIPTQVAAIEAIARVTPNDTLTIAEMQQWLLQQKRTQTWESPIASVNAIHAFLCQEQGERSLQPKDMASLAIDGKTLELPQATAQIGYVKTSVTGGKGKRLTVRKPADGMAWGALYAQFVQKGSEVETTGNGIHVKRELKPVGPGANRVKVVITLTADRDLDFVQVVDRRAASMEPVVQTSGYRQGAYTTPKDSETCYFFDVMHKGTHVIETEYYVNPNGHYQQGSCSAQCAYAPEMRGVTR